MDRIERVTLMEQRLDRALKAIANYKYAADEYISAQDDIQMLADYYFGPQWMEDHEADERGELPPDLKRGVLSEDAVYDLICENDYLRKEKGMQDRLKMG